LRQRDFDGALELAETARRSGLVDACIFGLKGHALSNLGRHEEAAEAYTEALKLGPEDPYVRHLVAAHGGLPGSDRAPLPYVRAVFNNYAEGFESHLISLGYRVPGLVREALLEAVPMPTSGKPLGPVLDLGCGTGLAAVVLADLPVGPFVGVDISSGMLAQARRKQLYVELREQDVLIALAEETRRYPVVLAADVFCYFGALEEAFARVHACLQPGGVFIFSVETLLPEKENSTPARQDWMLGSLGRYAHAPSYIKASAQTVGFQVRAMNQEGLRQEGLEPVQGLIVTLERARADG
jgi:predicted TPR repeat methyltransferase